MAKKADRKRQAIPANESKADRFKRIAAPRVAKALKAIRQIGFCAGSGYESTPEQQKQIREYLEKELVALGSSFRGKTESASEFTFDK